MVEGYFIVVGIWVVSQNLAGFDVLIKFNKWGLVVVGVLVGVFEFMQYVGVVLVFVIYDGDEVSGDIFYNISFWGDDEVAGVVSCVLFYIGINKRCFGMNQWYSLVLYVCIYQCMVSIVVF